MSHSVQRGRPRVDGNAGRWAAVEIAKLLLEVLHLQIAAEGGGRRRQDHGRTVNGQ